MAAIDVDGLSMVYDNGFQALHEVSVSAEAGEFITLLGPSGCGKTTLLRLIAGFLQPTEGTIRLGEEDITGLPPEKRDTAMVFQSYALFPHMTAVGNIQFGLKQQRLPKPEQLDRIEKSLAAVSLEDQRDKRPVALSGGQQQRVALARALAMRPSVVLFDEPLSNLDAKLREQVRFELRALQREFGFTAVYVTHDQAEALAMSDVVYLMNRGRIVQHGPPEAIYRRPNSRFVADFLGVANIFEGRVLSNSGSRYSVSSPFGELDVESDVPPSAEHLYLCWRPEDARLTSSQSGGQNHFDLRVTESVFLGNLTDVFGHPTDAEDTTVRVQLLQHGRVEPGTTISVAIDPANIRFLEPIELAPVGVSA